jgi:DNA primase
MPETFKIYNITINWFITFIISHASTLNNLNKMPFGTDVADFLKAKGSEKLRILRRIQAEGDHKYNELHPDKPIVRKRSKTNVARERCPSCKIMISNFHSVRHLR